MQLIALELYAGYWSICAFRAACTVNHSNRYALQGRAICRHMCLEHAPKTVFGLWTIYKCQFIERLSGFVSLSNSHTHTHTRRHVCAACFGSVTRLPSVSGHARPALVSRLPYPYNCPECPDRSSGSLQMRCARNACDQLWVARSFLYTLYTVYMQWILSKKKPSRLRVWKMPPIQGMSWQERN